MPAAVYSSTLSIKSSTPRNATGLSQADFYQMYAYGSAGKRCYDDIVLLYPTSKVAQHTFHQGELRLHVRQFDPRNIFDAESHSPDEREVAKELNKAFFIV